MNRSLSLLSAITLSSAALFSVQPQEASAMTIAFDCFERSTEKLVARSAVDMTSTAISCLPVPGTSTSTSTESVDQGDPYGDTLEAGHTTSDDQPALDHDGDNGWEPDDTTSDDQADLGGCRA